MTVAKANIELAAVASAMLILTSNLGVKEAAKNLGFRSKGHREGRAYTQAAEKFFKPQFFNRIDAIVGFRALDEDSILAITRKELEQVAGREGLSAVNTTIRWTETLVRHIAKEGFDARYGARPLQRAIEQLIVAPLARFLLEHPAHKGKTIAADFIDARVIFSTTGDTK